ncbi:MAG TPA: hypothetical protein VMV29_14055 [Ktedonobacterales bacterium]|nr:hypothetical protein [Ktedonobacterales bacterium]
MFPTTPTQGVVQPSMPAPGVQYPQSWAQAPTIPAPATPRRERKWLVIVVFCLFAGLIPETIITSSTSPLKIVLNPLSLPFIALFYGTADLLVREIIVRRRVGLASVLLLGAAFGFVNEGVAAGTWYTVHNPALIFIGGVDWTWALALTIFHIIISVITPIAFIEIVFPSIRGKPLLRRWGMAICGVLFFGFALLVALTPLYRPYRLSVLAVAVLSSLLALALPPRRASTLTLASAMPAPTAQPLAAPTYPGLAATMYPTAPQPPAYVAPPTTTYPWAYPPPQPAMPPPAQLTSRPLPGLWRLRAAGFVAMFAYFFFIYLFPVLVAAFLKSPPGGLVIAQGIDCAVLLAFSALVIWRGWSWSRRVGWSPRQNLALLIGGVTFTTLVMFLPGQIALGEPVATIPFYALLIALAVRWRRLT